MENVEEYKSIFFNIINGYSNAFHSQFNQVFIKHLTYIELSELEVKYVEYLNQAKSQGILPYKEKEEQVIFNGLWKQNDEIDLEINEKAIRDLKINYSKDFLYSRRQILKEQIQSFQNKINSLRLKKSYYIGQVAEDFANRKLVYDRITNSFFKNKDCSDLLINNDDIDDEKYEELQRIYYINHEKLSTENIKKIALSPFFTSIYHLCQDNAYSFYGKPIVELTNLQCDLISYGRYFKNLLSQRQDIPKEIMNNPNELMEWIEIRDNAEQAGIIGDNDNADGSKSIVGGTKKDFEMLGIKTEERFSLRKELEKSGGTLNAAKMFELTG